MSISLSTLGVNMTSFLRKSLRGRKNAKKGFLYVDYNEKHQFHTRYFSYCSDNRNTCAFLEIRTNGLDERLKKYQNSY